jgi:hypothetical protein
METGRNGHRKHLPAHSASARGVVYKVGRKHLTPTLSSMLERVIEQSEIG